MQPQTKYISKEDLQKLDAETISLETVIIDNNTSIDELNSYSKEIEPFSVVGFDTETKPAFKKGIHNKVALIQLATPKKVYLIRVFKMAPNSIKSALQQILNNTNQIKVGVGIVDDVLELKKDYGLDVTPICELRKLSKEAGIEVTSLSKIYAVLFNKRLAKGQRVTDWEAKKLSDAQINYAGLDAEAGLKIYNALDSFVKKEFIIDSASKVRAQQKKINKTKKIKKNPFKLFKKKKSTSQN